MPDSKKVKTENSKHNEKGPEEDQAVIEEEQMEENTTEKEPEPEYEEAEGDSTPEEEEAEENRKESDGEESGSDESVKDNPEYQALNEKYLRLYAEFDNFRKRTARENLELIKTANCQLLEKLIPTLEHFEIAFAPEQKAKKLEDFEEGIKMIYNCFKDVLEEEGLEEINPEGEEFDPVYHEAMLEQNHDTVEEGHVIQVYQKGYKVKSKILKYAKVITSKGNGK
ncbi:nucleotide exchange factor GrpE [Fibrobacterota bacterium]